jgi:hypothetical protein
MRTHTAVLIAVLAAAAPAAADEVDTIACMPKKDFKKLVAKFPASEKVVYDSFLTRKFEHPDKTCLFLNGPDGIEDGRKDKVEATFVDAFKQAAQATSIPKQADRWACFKSGAGTTALWQSFKRAYAITDRAQFRSLVVRDGQTCYRVAAVEAFKEDLGADFVEAVLKGEMVDGAKMAEENARPWDKVKYEKYPTVTALPAAGMKGGVTDELWSAVAGAFKNSNIAATAKVHKCVVTSRAWKQWSEAGSGAHSARSIEGACAVEVDANVCIVFHDGCKQEHLGLGKYAACQHQAYNWRAPARIDCKRAR